MSLCLQDTEQLWFGNKGGKHRHCGTVGPTYSCSNPTPPLADAMSPAGHLQASRHSGPLLGFCAVFICENSFHSLGWPFLFPPCLLPDANSGMLINSRHIILGHSDKDRSLAAGLVGVTGQQLSSHAPDIHQTALRVYTEEVTPGLNLVDNQGRFP